MADSSNRSSRYFLFLCMPDRQLSYQGAVATAPCPFVFASNLEEFLLCCIERPPIAAFADIVTVTRLGPTNIAPIFELGVIWPVMRCQSDGDGACRVMCIDPSRSAAMEEAIAELADNDRSWENPRYRRRRLRLDVRCRVRLRVLDEERWRPGNSLNLSSASALVVTYDVPAAGDKVEIEIADLGAPPLRMTGQVVWARRWQDSPDLPAVAVAFEPSSVSAAFARSLAKREYLPLLQ